MQMPMSEKPIHMFVSELHMDLTCTYYCIVMFYAVIKHERSDPLINHTTTATFFDHNINP